MRNLEIRERGGTAGVFDIMRGEDPVGSWPEAGRTLAVSALDCFTPHLYELQRETPTLQDMQDIAADLAALRLKRMSHVGGPLHFFRLHDLGGWGFKGRNGIDENFITDRLNHRHRLRLKSLADDLRHLVLDKDPVGSLSGPDAELKFSVCSLVGSRFCENWSLVSLAEAQELIEQLREVPLIRYSRFGRLLYFFDGDHYREGESEYSRIHELFRQEDAVHGNDLEDA